MLNDTLAPLNPRPFVIYDAQRLKIVAQRPEAKMLLGMPNELALNANMLSLCVLSKNNKQNFMIWGKWNWFKWLNWYSLFSILLRKKKLLMLGTYQLA